jgi:NAD(P)-dependent dehydrogenase (short-subunit alcohol dehydrogenase family)
VAVNNAGIAAGGRASLHETAPEDWERVLAVNLTGPFLVCRAVLPSMVRRRAGVVVNVASAAGIVALPGRCHYAASKAALIHLTRTLAVEYADAGIRANALCPGYIDTPLVRAGLGDPARAERLRRIIPMHRLADADEIAGAALFLASDASRYMTGQALVVDGGWTAV